MSVNLFNRPELGPGLGSIEVFDLLYMPSAPRLVEATKDVPFSVFLLEGILTGR